PQCPDHPNENSETACRACKLRREWDQANEQRAAADELDAKRRSKQVQANCPRCQGTNTYEDDLGVHPCQPHLEAINA
ncbi:hypothetical protein, partial [Mycolicibacterium sphagni]